MTLNLSLVASTGEPEQWPVKVEEMKAHLKITHVDEDDYIQDVIIPSAVASVEADLRRALITQSWEWVFDNGFPATGMIQFPKPPLQSVTSVMYLDTDGASQTFASSNYTVGIKGTFGRLWLNESITWPDTQIQTPESATITFVAGYGNDQDDVPGGIRSLIMLLGAHIYENRQPTVTGTIISKIPFNLEYLASTHRAWDFAALPT